MPDKIAKIAEKYVQILELLGENPKREGLRKTPERVGKSLSFLTEGYEKDAEKIINSAKFQEKNATGNLVCVKDIEFFSLCEHHILPFWGTVHIAYIPNRYIVGLSKIPRIVNVFARRLQVQERLTHELLDILEKHLQPKGIAVVIQAQHMCMMMRGVEKKGSLTVTSAYSGAMKDDFYKNDFLKLLPL